MKDKIKKGFKVKAEQDFYTMWGIALRKAIDDRAVDYSKRLWEPLEEPPSGAEIEIDGKTYRYDKKGMTCVS